MKIKFVINYVMEEVNNKNNIKIRSISYNILKENEVVVPVLFGGIYKVVEFERMPDEIVCFINPNERFFLKDICLLNKNIEKSLGNKFDAIIFRLDNQQNIFTENEDKKIVKYNIYIGETCFVFYFLTHKNLKNNEFEKIKSPWQTSKEFKNYNEKLKIFQVMAKNYFEQIKKNLIEQKLNDIENEVKQIIKFNYPYNYDDIINTLVKFKPTTNNINISFDDVNDKILNKCKFTELA